MIGRVVEIAKAGAGQFDPANRRPAVSKRGEETGRIVGIDRSEAGQFELRLLLVENLWR